MTTEIDTAIAPLCAEIKTLSKQVATLCEKVQHPCEAHAGIEHRITTIEASSAGKGATINRLLVVLALLIALMAAFK